MEICPGCKTPVRSWHKKCEGNTRWHYRCMITSNNAHDLAHDWSEKECFDAGLPSPWEIYLTKGSIGERYISKWNALLDSYELKDWWYERQQLRSETEREMLEEFPVIINEEESDEILETIPVINSDENSDESTLEEFEVIKNVR